MSTVSVCIPAVSRWSRKWAFTCLLKVGALSVLFLLGACTSKYPPGYHANDAYGYATPGRSPTRTVDGSIAILGVTASKKKLRPFQRKNYATDLESHVRSHVNGLAILPHNRVLATLGPGGHHKSMLDRYRANGRLTEADWRVLESALLPVRFILVARIDRNDTARFEPVKTPMKNSHGDALTDRQKITLYNKRTVEVAARLYDMKLGKEVWAGAFVSEPLTENSFTDYTGSSFAGSMATLLTNSFVQGRGRKDYPEAPSSSVALKETFKGIAQALANR